MELRGRMQVAGSEIPVMLPMMAVDSVRGADRIDQGEYKSSGGCFTITNETLMT